MKHSFLMCGTVGLCMEVFWTGAHCIKSRDFRLMGQSSILMFPIYGMAALIGPLSQKLTKFPRLIRGGIYTAGIFAAEFCSGTLLRRFCMCPWDYSKCKFNFKGLIRLDYTPLWFLAGLFFESLLQKNN